ncbi:MAG: Hsp20/alpha crystallin family protein [Pyrinomonadaceae bacterium]
MAKSTNRYFQFLGSSKNAQSGQLWYPAADVYQTSDGWVVKVELAGVSVEDIAIDVQGNVLYIAGCRKDRSCGVGGAYQQMEITYSNFEKTLKFPASIEGVQLDHMFENGLLIIRLKKGEAVNPQGAK